MNQNKINNAVEKLLNEKSSSFTKDELNLLAEYEPNTGRNKLYSFFTPLWLCDVMVKLAIRNGFNPKTDKVLEPSAGTGNFITSLVENGVKPENIRGFELDETNYIIAKGRNPKVNLHHQFFEIAFLEPPKYRTKAKQTWLKEYPYDLVIGNPPYGANKNKYSSFFKTPKFRQLEQFFMFKSLELLKKDGLLVFITGSNFLRNDFTYQKEKKAIGELAELVDGYRMPKVFKNTQVPTDILIFKRK